MAEQTPIQKKALILDLDLYKGGHPKVLAVVEYNGGSLKALLLDTLMKVYKKDGVTKNGFLNCAIGTYSSGNKAYTLAGEESSYSILVV